MSETQKNPTPPDRSALHEGDEIKARPVLLLGGGLVIIIGVVLAAMSWLFAFFGRYHGVGVASPVAEGRTLPPAPRLQVTPAHDLGSMRENEERLLKTYEWVDQPAGVVRIPIHRAIEVVAQKGLPVRPTVGQARRGEPVPHAEKRK